MNDSHNFRISISYSGRNREFVKQVDQELLKYLDHSEVFYDQRYSALMARPDLDGWLRDLFRDGSDLVVCFLSKAHEQSPWCQVESNAVREAFQGQVGAPPLLFTDGDYEVGMGFSMDFAQSIEGLTPKQVAEMIVKRYKYHFPKITVKSPVQGRRRFFGELAIVLGLMGGITALNSVPDLDELVPDGLLKSGNSAESVVGVVGFILLFIAVVWGMYRAKNFLKPRDREVKYVDPPTGSGHPSASDWEQYARELEDYTEKERHHLADSLLEIRQRRFILMASIFLSIVLVVGHTLLWLFLEYKDGPEPTFLTGASAPWDFAKIFKDHPAHFWLGAFYLLTVFIFSFIVSNRTKRPFSTAAFLGAWQPLYLGIIYVLFISTLNYADLFETGLPASKGDDVEVLEDTFFDEPGNFYVLERIVITPVLCWTTALLAAWFGVMARGKPRLPANE